jgi:hypothetical protein
MFKDNIILYYLCAYVGVYKYLQAPRALTFYSLLVTWCTNKFYIQQLYDLPTLNLRVLYSSENKQRLVPLTA